MNLGVVSYLNMMPFFGGPGETVSFASPVELNRALVEGRVDAGCVSAVAGIENGLDLVGAGYGVATSGAVGSVFLEPVVASRGDECFWSSVSKRVMGLLREGIPPVPHPSEQLALLTSGESAQSVWLFSVLFRLMGVEVRPVSCGLGSMVWQRELLLQEARRLGLSEKRLALLAIGDRALERSLRLPSPSVPRIDLGRFWEEAAGLPCVFAAWFARAGGASCDERVQHLLQVWFRLSDAERQRKVKEWSLGRDGDHFSENRRLSYLANLQLEFGGDHRRTLEIYQKLLAVAGN